MGGLLLVVLGPIGSDREIEEHSVSLLDLIEGEIEGVVAAVGLIGVELDVTEGPRLLDELGLIEIGEECIPTGV